MNTACVLIGNSDNKLSQIQWSFFIDAVQEALAHFSKTMHFRGYSSGDSCYQNACWVLTIDPNQIQEIKDALSPIKETYIQDSIAFIAGNVEFI